MSPLPEVGELTPWIVWVVDTHGWSVEVADQDAAAAFASRPSTNVIAVTCTDFVPDVEAAWDRIFGSSTPSRSRRALLTPCLVPPDWDRSLVGVQGRAAAQFTTQTRQPGLVVAVFDASPGELGLLAARISARIESEVGGVTTVGRARTVLERLVDPALVCDPREPKPSYADAIRSWERFVEELEDVVYRGSALSRDDLGRIELALQELVGIEGLMPAPLMEAERVGLVGRLVRLRDTVATRDAQGTLTTVLSSLTGFVLVPALVAGVYGSNVDVPLGDSQPGWRAMVAFMASGGVLALVLLTGIQVVGGRLLIVLPGCTDRRAGDTAWPLSVGFAGLLGAAAATVWLAITATASDQRFDESSTLLGLRILAITLGVLIGALLVRDFIGRGGAHASLILVAFVGACLGVRGVFDCDQVSLLVGGGLSLALGLCAMLPGTARRIATRSRAWTP